MLQVVGSKSRKSGWALVASSTACAGSVKCYIACLYSKQASVQCAGQSQRAFDLMCNRMLDREVRGRPLATRQLMMKFVFDSYAEIQSARCALCSF